MFYISNLVLQFFKSNSKRIRCSFCPVKLIVPNLVIFKLFCESNGEIESKFYLLKTTLYRITNRNFTSNRWKSPSRVYPILLLIVVCPPQKYHDKHLHDLKHVYSIYMTVQYATNALIILCKIVTKYCSS